ncbi:hypothetical protein V6N12_047594 [Hibiscus sabdariffa]|uniref:Thaumatin-like protein n=1 Tax=Hibiscus sabdariffa TaxID=183260 RepID=A0ABR1ZGE5_9ROSI
MKSLQVAVVHLLLMFSGKSLAHTVTFYVHNKCPFPIWPATAPNKQSSDSRQGDSNWQPACKTGDCDGRLQCNGLIGKPPATLVQVELKGDKGKPNFYDRLLKNLNNLCPQELQVVNKDGKVVARRSACMAFDINSFCCRNEYGTPEKCKPSLYSNIFKDACPCYYSYAFDMPPPLENCTSKEYVITFCPSAWGTDQASI